MEVLKIWKNRLYKFWDNPRAIFPFLKKRLYYNFVADRQLPYYDDFKYLDYNETIQEIVTHNRSIVRFGDELFDMLQGIGLYYGNWRQKYDPKLAERLKEVISSRDPRLLVAFNPEFILKTKQGFKDEGIPEQYHFWTNAKMFLKDYYHKDVVYGSALCFTPRYNTAIDYGLLRDFFSKKHIFIVTSNIERFEDVSLGISTSFIEAPSSDAWQQYDAIYERLTTTLAQSGISKNEILVLVSMGSAAKVLVYDFTKLGYVAWDTGQFFDLAFKNIKSELAS